MRSLRSIALLALAFAAPFAIVRPASRAADGDSDTSFESAKGLYAAAELGLGGRPLYQALFPNGWPTTKEFRRMTLDEGEAAFADSIGSMLGSGLGVPLDVSMYERDRLAKKQETGGGKAPGTVDAYLPTRWEEFRTLSGLQSTVESFHPVFLPYRRGDPIPAAPFDESKPGTWSWQQKGQDTLITLDAIGLSMYAYTIFAEQQLAAERTVTASGVPTTYIGRNDVDGFLGFVALECAIASMRELREKLCMSKGAAGNSVLGAFPKSVAALVAKGTQREVYYPHGLTATVNRATVTYAVGTGAPDIKMRLYDQAAVLLGLCELAKASAPGKKGSNQFFASDRKGPSFPETTYYDAIELAGFVASSIKNISWNPGNAGNCSSFATTDAWGDALRTEDAGLLLLALEQFIALTPAKADAEFVSAQKGMSTVVDHTTSFLLNVQKTSTPAMTGFCDNYNLAGESPAETQNGVEKRSLFAQGLVVRGLLAANRTTNLANYSGKKPAGLKESALLVLKWLEDARWDGKRRAYVEEKGKGTKTRAVDAAAVLGALRDVALDTGDARYLLRYKDYLTTLRARGLFLAETARSRADLAGAKSPQEAGKAPVLAAEVSIP
jgi:hypothetical protein